MFEGVHTAIVTPFIDGEVDYDGLAALLEHQIAGGVDGVVPCGTTGESATVSEAERIEIIRKTVEIVAGRCQVIAGTGTNNTRQSVALTQAALKAGADGALVITPYYNRPTQEGLYQHCRTVAEAVPDLPIMLYNVPARTSVSFTVETVVRLADVPNIVAIKEATGNMVFAAKIVRGCGITVLSGDDTSALAQWAIGGRGVVSVASNLAPDRVVKLWRLFEAGDWAEARELHLDLVPLFTGMFIEASPAPVKALVARVIECRAEARLPIVPIQPGTVLELEAICAKLEIPLGPR